jgi:fucose permease
MKYRLVSLLLALVCGLAAQVPAYPAIESGFELSVASGLLANPVVLLSGLLLFCYIGLEVSAASWTTTYLKGAGFAERRASVIFSLFWVAMMVGRLAPSQWVTTALGKAAIEGAALAAAIILLLMTLGATRFLAAPLVIALGFFFAPLFPTIVGVTFARFQPVLYGTVFAIIFALGLLGSTLVPAAIGFVSKTRSIRTGYRLMVALAALLFLFAFAL